MQRLIERVRGDAMLTPEHVGEGGVEILDREEIARRGDFVPAHITIIIVERLIGRIAQYAER